MTPDQTARLKLLTDAHAAAKAEAEAMENDATEFDALHSTRNPPPAMRGTVRRFQAALDAYAVELSDRADEALHALNICRAFYGLPSVSEDHHA